MRGGGSEVLRREGRVRSGERIGEGSRTDPEM